MCLTPSNGSSIRYIPYPKIDVILSMTIGLTSVSYAIILMTPVKWHRFLYIPPPRVYAITYIYNTPTAKYRFFLIILSALAASVYLSDIRVRYPERVLLAASYATVRDTFNLGE